MLGLGSSIVTQGFVEGEAAPLLLDTYTGPAAAYSLRKLSNSYTGSAIEVSDGTNTQDIGFDANGDLDTSALATFCGSNDGVVTKWYDQSGNSNDATQATPSSQPKIYDGDDGVVTENGKPAVMSSDATNLSFSLISDIQSVFLAGALTAVGAKKNFILGYSNGYDYHCGNNVNAFLDPSITTNTDVRDGSNYRNGTLTNFGTTAQTVGRHLLSMIHLDATGRANQITRDRSNTRSWNGPLYEIILYNSDQSANRTDIEDNINDYYSIY